MNASGTCALILVPLFCKPRCRVSLMEDNGLERMRGELTAIFTGRILAMGIHRPKSPTLSLTRQYGGPFNDLGPSSSHQSCPDCMIATGGYDFQERQG